MPQGGGCKHTLNLADFSQIVMDNATRGSWPFIQQKFPWIVCSPCQPHVLDLLLEDAGKLEPFKGTLARARKLAMFLRREKVKATLRELCNLVVALPGETRFYTQLLLIESLEKVRNKLGPLFAHERVVDYVHANRNDVCDGQTLAELCAAMEQTTKDGAFWSSLRVIRSFMEPVAKLLQFSESNAPVMGEIYYGWFQLVEKVKSLDIQPPALKQQLVGLVERRWEYGHTCIHGAGYALNPRFVSCDHDEHITIALDNFMRRTLAAPPLPQLPDSMDPLERETLLSEWRLKKDKADEEMAQFSRELLEYRLQRGTFAATNTDVWKNAVVIPPAEWWLIYGGTTPMLRKVAMRALGQVVGAAEAERTHKVMNNTVTLKRTRLGRQKINKLMRVSINRRTVDKIMSWQAGKDSNNPALPELGGEEGEEDDELPDAWAGVGEPEDEEEREDEAAAAAALALEHARRGAQRAAQLARAPAGRRPLPLTTRSGRSVMASPRLDM